MVFFGVLISWWKYNFDFSLLFQDQVFFDKHFLKISSFLLLGMLHRLIANEAGERCQFYFDYFSRCHVVLCTDNVEHQDCIFLRGMSFQTQKGERWHSKKQKMAWLCLPKSVGGTPGSSRYPKQLLFFFLLLLDCVWGGWWPFKSTIMFANKHALVLISCVCPTVDWDEEDRQAKRIDS